jgi:hypothetical protein
VALTDVILQISRSAEGVFSLEAEWANNLLGAVWSRNEELFQLPLVVKTLSAWLPVNQNRAEDRHSVDESILT